MFEEQNVLRLRATVRGIKPRIWREVELPVDLRLSFVHIAMQALFGWKDYHLHEFRAGAVEIGPRYDDPPRWLIEEGRLTLEHIARRARDSFVYAYDFGDGWEIDVETIATAHASTPVVRCLGGERAGPPEDCGGPLGYARLVKVLRNPRHREYASLREWAGDFDPEAFDAARVDRVLDIVRERLAKAGKSRAH